MSHKYTNRLIHEKSPYLLQHAHNPVDWYPWGEEAFKAAEARDKPIFLSIGYSTCHWCHVMEHESFEDSAVAALMNDAFISIKVDREERPDVDDIYMTVCQMVTGSGGWPLTIIMTPDKRPFFAATYIPKNQRFNRPGMMELIPQIKNAWQNDRQRVLESAGKITDYLGQSTINKPGASIADSVLQMAAQQLSDSYDEKFGGFSERPKFPSAHNLMFLLRQYKRSGNGKNLTMVENTLQHMRKGGVYDHIGFGFHRYSTDRKWLVPHFEKMLYDQAINAMAYTEAFQVTGKPEYQQTAREVLRYVQRDMTDEKGGFYSAEDADSDGEEGKFYVWRTSEIRDILGEKDANFFDDIYGLTDAGNFEDEATRQKTGANIPHLKKSLREIAAEKGIAETALHERLENIRQKLFDVREKRIHPLKDDKVLTDWNGLMIAAFSKAARAFDEPKFADAARNAADFILSEMRLKNGRLLHRYREGQKAINAYLDDYAFMSWGLIELYETTFETRYLKAAIEFTDILLEHFWDQQNYGFFFTTDDATDLLVRKKEIYDGAIPSGNSVAMLNLLRLGRITGNTGYEEKASRLGQAFSGQINRYPAGYTMMMIAVDFAAGPSHEVVITGKPENTDTVEMIKALNRPFIPNKIVVFRPAGESDPKIAQIAEYAASMTAINHKATAYVCQNFACELPTNDAQKMLELLGNK